MILRESFVLVESSANLWILDSRGSFVIVSRKYSVIARALQKARSNPNHANLIIDSRKSTAENTQNPSFTLSNLALPLPYL